MYHVIHAIIIIILIFKTLQCMHIFVLWTLATIYEKSFKGENFCGFHDFIIIVKVF